MTPCPAVGCARSSSRITRVILESLQWDVAIVDVFLHGSGLGVLEHRARYERPPP